MGTNLESEFLIHILKSNRRVFYRNTMKMNAKKLRSTQEQSNTTLKQKHCMSAGQRLCEDGSCIARIELCPEEQMMNQNTILVMVVVGLAVVIFLVILYCFQQRQRRHLGDEGETGCTENDYDHASLYAPPPNYEEVINTNLYPPTPQQQRFQLRRKSLDEPLTPPPNYDAALIILAKSQDSIFSRSRNKSSVFRRSISLEQMDEYENERSPSIMNNNDSETPKSQKKRRSIFRFSRQFSRPLSIKDYTSVPSQPSSRSPSVTLPCSPILPPSSPALQSPFPQTSPVPPSPPVPLSSPVPQHTLVPPLPKVPPTCTASQSSSRPSSPDVHFNCLPLLTEETIS